MLSGIDPQRVTGGGNDQIAGFPNGHEIAHHIGMGGRHRPANGLSFIVSSASSFLL
jgi:hypothetical protein